MIEALTGQGIDVRHACQVLGVSRGGYYAWKGRPISKTGLRRIWLGKEIIEIHKESRGTYGVPRVTAELANQIHDYIELFHNTRRRHSSLNMLTPAEFERQHSKTYAA